MSKSKLPNIILFSIDTLRADRLSCYGYGRKTSPYIDAFAKDAVVFKNTISQAPVTAPAHMSIFTALTPLVHGVIREDDLKVPYRLSEHIPTLPVILKQNGYMNIGLHGGGQVSGEYGFDKGFDRYQRDWYPQITDALQRSSRQNIPLFLFLHHFVCHEPYLIGPQEYRSHFLSERVAGLPACCADIPRDLDWRLHFKAFWKDVDLSNPKHLAHIVSLYDGGVYYSDYIFAKLIEILKKEHLYDNTIIVLVSDHGEEFYEHGGKSHGRLLIEHLHVPLIIKFLNNRYSGRVITQPVRSMDIMPTLFDYLGIKATNPMQGISLFPLITKSGRYNPLIVSYSWDGKDVRFIKDGFVYSRDDWRGQTALLFDAKNDPREMKNISSSNPEILKQMKIIADEIREKDMAVKEKLNSSPTVFVKNKQLKDQLKALGYMQ